MYISPYNVPVTTKQMRMMLMIVKDAGKLWKTPTKLVFHRRNFLKAGPGSLGKNSAKKGRISCSL